MSNSIVFYHGRDDVIYVIDPEAVPHSDELPPLFDVVIAMIKAGYQGVVVDEKRLNNGRVMHCLSIVEGTPEGTALQDLMAIANAGKPLPSIDSVLAQLRAQYDEIGERHE